MHPQIFNIKQMELPFSGDQLKEVGMRMASDNAERVNNGWTDKCYELFIAFVELQDRPFKMEDFRAWASDKIDTPPSLRAYGSISMKAAKRGLIKHAGYAKVDNPKAHRANASLWIKSIN